MGLDNFKKDDNEETVENSNSDVASGTDDSDDNSSGSSNEGGLESFKSGVGDGGSQNKDGIDNQDNTIFGIPAFRIAEMSEEQQIKSIRQTKIPDYKPDATLDDRWSYTRIIEVECVCGKIFTFSNKETCSACGRLYKDAGRTVVKAKKEDSDN